MAFRFQIDSPNITLLRLVVNNPEKFHNQDWYFDEEFANRALPVGSWELGTPKDGTWILPYAALCAWAFVNYYGACAHLLNKFVWTGDKDGAGNRVYVGGLSTNKYGLFEVHRHLADPEIGNLEGRLL